ncbi:MAG TPA: hypothetical protein GXX51_01325 [Firmicutes bacterium]|nr:hypothetical protein [Bacillota bacterium]
MGSMTYEKLLELAPIEQLSRAAEHLGYRGRPGGNLGANPGSNSGSNAGDVKAGMDARTDSKTDSKTDSRGNPKRELIRYLVERLTEPAYVEEVYRGLSSTERLALLMIIFADATGEGVLREVHDARVDEFLHSRGKARAAGEALWKAGLIVIVNLKRGGHLYLVPAEIRARVLSLFAGEVARSAALKPSDLKSSSQPAGQPGSNGVATATRLLCDIFVFLAHLRNTPTKLTREGMIYKRAQEAILSNFMEPEVLAKPAGATAAGKAIPMSYPERLGFIIHFCFDTNLIEEVSASGEDRWNGDTYVVPSAAVREWVGLPPGVRLARVFSYWNQEWDRVNPIHAQILEFLSCLPVGLPLRIDKVFEALDAFIRLLGNRTLRYEGNIHRFLRPLCYMGVLETNFEAPVPVLTLTEFGSEILGRLLSGCDPSGLMGEAGIEEDGFHVQPDFEVLASRNLRQEILWQLDEVASSVKMDNMIVYRLTRESASRAMQAGWSGGDILEFLRKHSRNPLPQNVEFSIKDWCKNYGKVRFIETMLLRCEDDATAEAVKAILAGKGMILGEITPRDLMVDRNAYERMVQILERSGYFPRPGVYRLERVKPGNDAVSFDKLDAELDRDLRDLLGLVSPGPGDTKRIYDPHADAPGTLISLDDARRRKRGYGGFQSVSLPIETGRQGRDGEKGREP